MWLVQELLTDPAAHTTAAVNGWAHPASRDWLILASLHDVTVQINTKKGSRAQRWPRPWADDTSKRMGHTDLSPDAARAVLARMSGRS